MTTTWKAADVPIPTVRARLCTLPCSRGKPHPGERSDCVGTVIACSNPPLLGGS